MHGDFECPRRSASVGTTAPDAPEPTTAGQLQHGKLARRTTVVPAGKRGHCTFRVTMERDEEIVTDLQAYLKLFCRRRALVELGDHGVALHFEAAGDAAIFSGLWTVWAAAGLVPTSGCRHRGELDRLRPNGMGAIRR